MKTCVVIPTYNEARAIADVVRQVRQQNLDLDIVVIDDGSKDNTAGIARESGASVLRNQQNLGKGASLIKGFGYALNKDFDAVITMDGDGQHLASDIPYFIRLAKFSESGILIGNRMSKPPHQRFWCGGKPKSMPWIRILTNRFMSWFISNITRQKIPDTQCGLRLIKKEVLEKLKLKTHKYETESEILIRASRLGFKIESIPVRVVYNNEKSQINPFVDTLRFIRFIVKELWTTRS